MLVDLFVWVFYFSKGFLGAKIKAELERIGVSVKFDNRDTHKPGYKFAEYEFKGVPLRVALGPRDLENNTVELARRDLLSKQIVDNKNMEQFSIKLRPPLEVRENYILRFNELII